jgi:hypothetical protein
MIAALEFHSVTTGAGNGGQKDAENEKKNR